MFVSVVVYLTATWFVYWVNDNIKKKIELQSSLKFNLDIYAWIHILCNKLKANYASEMLPILLP
jgi:hypothetical protein